MKPPPLRSQVKLGSSPPTSTSLLKSSRELLRSASSAGPAGMPD